MTTEEIHDSPDEYVAAHIRRFLETDGRPRPGVNDLLLTTRGRRSGKFRRTVLVHARDGERFILAASNAGADHHPAWYLNLVADPHVTVQVGTEVFAATAHTATATEKPRLWALIVAAMPSYRAYQESTARDIPVVVVERRP
jgi:deazaflavin-dependent oxidoreductase (nitroreductase family)